ncbi:MAG: hypothetical protein AC479_07320 [miscellaneous Crenarchaeota group-6 archaeon AD8-1]|nr:MAG: hypothetical protein AC479_07320 [miscellaneous Crenarchaeota group-6 archaeon AD8-1]
MTIQPAINLTVQYIWQDTILLLTIIALILLVLTELLSPKYGKITTKIDRNKLKKIAFATGILALTNLILRILWGGL